MHRGNARGPPLICARWAQRRRVPVRRVALRPAHRCMVRDQAPPSVNFPAVAKRPLGPHRDGFAEWQSARVRRRDLARAHNDRNVGVRRCRRNVGACGRGRTVHTAARGRHAAEPARQRGRARRRACRRRAVPSARAPGGDRGTRRGSRRHPEPRARPRRPRRRRLAPHEPQGTHMRRDARQRLHVRRRDAGLHPRPQRVALGRRKPGVARVLLGQPPAPRPPLPHRRGHRRTPLRHRQRPGGARSPARGRRDVGDRRGGVSRRRLDFRHAHPPVDRRRHHRRRPASAHVRHVAVAGTRARALRRRGSRGGSRRQPPPARPRDRSLVQGPGRRRPAAAPDQPRHQHPRWEQRRARRRPHRHRFLAWCHTSARRAANAATACRALAAHVPPWSAGCRRQLRHERGGPLIRPLRKREFRCDVTSPSLHAYFFAAADRHTLPSRQRHLRAARPFLYSIPRAFASFPAGQTMENLSFAQGIVDGLADELVHPVARFRRHHTRRRQQAAFVASLFVLC
mmetsp:Transcript_36855/g.113769  ORF Transcript_36855/g.113769 Transcript_36855/m.113769 type:complete len:513 (+) Transcript_36855:795-2333(+)